MSGRKPSLGFLAVVIVAVGASLLFGCGAGTPGPGDAEGSLEDEVETTTAALTSCTGKVTGPGNHVWTLTHGGHTRSFRVHVPPGYDPTRRTPLVLNFHGLGMNARSQELLTRFPEVADEEGFLTVAPTGMNGFELGSFSLTSSLRAWNAGTGCCGDAHTRNVDDVGFVRALLKKVDAQLCVDSTRVYATGFSNGAVLSYRLACEMSDTFAAVATVAGGNATSPCTPSRPVPLLHFHGEKDFIVPYQGNATSMLPIPSIVGTWAKQNGCGPGTKVGFQQGEVTCREYQGCAAPVTLCSVANGGHTWPGAVPLGAVGHTTADVDATREIWRMFSRHRLPSAP